MEDQSEEESRSLRRNIDTSIREPRRSVKFSAIPSTALMKALMNKMSSAKIKTQRRTSRMTERSTPKLIFDYGPTTYRGLMMHRKIKLAPFAEQFQKKYPQIRVYYHPITEYNVVIVRLKDCVVLRMLLSNLTYSATEDITKNSFYKLINQAIQRMMQYPNLLTRPFRDAVCLMTHNLDIDYDVPWYRTQFPRSVQTVNADSSPRQSNQAYFSPQQYNMVAAPSLVCSDAYETVSIHWKKFLQTIEKSPEYQKIISSESINQEIFST